MTPKTPQDEKYSLLIQCDEDGSSNVWLSLPDHDPIEDQYGFIIGTGTTRDEAVRNAVAEMEDVLERLQSPPGVIEERRG